jgi:hypothetical protein
MANKELKTYRLAWDEDNNIGTILVNYTQGTQKFVFNNAPAFLSAATIVQHEAPVYYDTTEKVFFCGTEDVNDGD